MKKIAFLKYLRSVHPVGLFLSVCGVLAAACLVPLIAFFIYMKGEPTRADMEKELQAVRQGRVKRERSGLVASAKHTMYVTRAADGTLTALWPYNLAHDDNYFEGYLFEERPLTTDKVTAFGPFRWGRPDRPPPVLTHLTVDRKISEHWYHVQGEMYK